MHIFKILGSEKKPYPCVKCSHVEFDVPEISRFHPLPVRLTKGSFVQIVCRKCLKSYKYITSKYESVIIP